MKMIRVDLLGWDCAIAMGLSVRGYAPLTMLARQLIREGVDPRLPLVGYRDGTLVLGVRSLGEAARLTDRGTLRFVHRGRPLPACGRACPVRKSRQVA